MHAWPKQFQNDRAYIGHSKTMRSYCGFHHFVAYHQDSGLRDRQGHMTGKKDVWEPAKSTHCLKSKFKDAIVLLYWMAIMH